MLYHVSPKKGLKTIRPVTSTHGKPYVYAVEDMVTGLLFGAKKDDFDLMIYTDENRLPVVYECYPDALKEVYQGRSCSVYLLNDEGFLRGVTSWEAELVCESEVEVVGETTVDDLLGRLLEEERGGRLILHRYEHSDEYRSIISDHIVDRIIRFGIDLNGILETDIRFSKHYRDIVQEMTRHTDGHLLK